MTFFCGEVFVGIEQNWITAGVYVISLTNEKNMLG